MGMGRFARAEMWSWALAMLVVAALVARVLPRLGEILKAPWP